MDRLVLEGRFWAAGAITLGATQLSGIDTIQLLTGADAGSFAYDLTMDDANAPGSAPMTIEASTLRAGESLHFSAASETSASYTIFSGDGADLLVAGAGADTLGLLGNCTLTFV